MMPAYPQMGGYQYSWIFNFNC